VAVTEFQVALTTVDFNQDGRQDIIVADYLANTVSVLLGVGDGTFQSSPPIHVGSHPVAVAAGRFDSDGDGLYEVAVANYGSGTVTILEGHRDGTFTISRKLRGDSPSPCHKLRQGRWDNRPGGGEQPVAQHLPPGRGGRRPFLLVNTVKLDTAPARW